MYKIDNLRIFFQKIFNKHKKKRRAMKRVFQMERYLEWKDLSYEEKLSVKRLILLPFLAYFIISIFNQFFVLISLLLIGYVLYRLFERNDIIKK